MCIVHCRFSCENSFPLRAYAYVLFMTGFVHVSSRHERLAHTLENEVICNVHEPSQREGREHWKAAGVPRFTYIVCARTPNKQSGRQVHALAHVLTHETLRLWHYVTTRRLTGIGEEHGKAQRQRSRWRLPRLPTPTFTLPQSLECLDRFSCSSKETP